MYLKESKRQTFKKNTEHHWSDDNVKKIFRFNIAILQQERVTVVFSIVPVFFLDKWVLQKRRKNPILCKCVVGLLFCFFLITP